jgi:ABC-type bacteriocin/lantibiotic exporter with double-glycine peptidase domain
MLRLVALLGVTFSVTACVSYSGGARAVDPARITSESGWIVAGPTRETRQQGSYDCGAAALAMIASRWNIPLSLANAVSALPKPTELGVPLGDLRDLARARGLTAFAIAGDRATLVHELRAGRPVIVGLNLPYNGRTFSHYEVIVAVREADAQFVTIDPSTGWRSRSWTDLDAEWKPAGRPTLVVLGPTAL